MRLCMMLYDIVKVFEILSVPGHCARLRSHCTCSVTNIVDATNLIALFRLCNCSITIA